MAFNSQTARKAGAKSSRKGTSNKVTADLRERVNNFLTDKWEYIEKDFKKLSPKDRMLFYEKLLSYGLPKLQNISADVTVDAPIPITGLKVT